MNQPISYKKLTIKEGEDAFKLDQLIEKCRQAMGENFLAMGWTFKKIRDGKHFAALLGGDYPNPTFEAYIATKRFSRATVYSWIRIYELFVEKFKVDKQRLIEAGWASLHYLLPIVDDKNYDEWLTKAEALSLSDVRAEIKAIKSNRLEEDEKDPIVELVDNLTKVITIEFSTDENRTKLAIQKVISKWLSKHKFYEQNR